MFAFFNKLLSLIKQQQKTVDTLKSRKERLEELLSNIDFRNDSYIVQIGSRKGINYEDLNFEFPEFEKWLIKSELSRLSRKINRLIVFIKLLKIKINYFKRNLRKYIRIIHHFTFNELDDNEDEHVVLQTSTS